MIDSVGDVATKDSKFEMTLFQNNGDMKGSMHFGQKPGGGGQKDILSTRHYTNTFSHFTFHDFTYYDFTDNTLLIMTLLMMTLLIMTLSIMSLLIMTLLIMTLLIMILLIMTIHITLNMCDITYSGGIPYN